MSDRTAPATTKNYMPALDGLRALSFLFVFMYHALQTAVGFGLDGLSQQLCRPFELGWVGVDVFFVLSGFLITRGLLLAPRDRSYFWNFYSKRVRRILPLYYLMCLLAFFAVPLLFPRFANAQSVFSVRWIYLAHGQNWIYAFSGLEIGYYGHLWSLAVEEQFYLLWPFAVFFLPRGRAGAAACAALAAIVLVARCAILLAWKDMPEGNCFFYCSTITRADAIFAGAALAYMSVFGRRFAELGRALPWCVPALLSAGIFLVCEWPSNPNASRLLQGVGYSIVAAGGVALVWLLSLPEFERSGFALPPVRYLGKISYGLYVYHWPILYFGAAAFAKAGLSGPAAAWAYILGSFAITVVVSSASYHGFERCFLGRKRTAAPVPRSQPAGILIPINGRGARSKSAKRESVGASAPLPSTA